MNNIVLISCAIKKKNYETKAKDLFISPLFKYNLRYSKFFKPSKIFLLSSKYGLLNLDEKIKPYYLRLEKEPIEKVKKWSEKVIKQLSEKTDLNKDNYIFLAGKKYREFLIPKLKNFDVPLKGLGIGKQIKFLKEEINKYNL